MPHDIRNYEESFQYDFNVSRETFEALLKYQSLLLKWNSRINLISKTTEGEIWKRHFYDCAQLSKHIPQDTKEILDIGTGAGFPGMVLAILASENNFNQTISLLDESTKRCAFLGEVSRATGAKVKIHNQKIEVLTGSLYDLITARAFAPLEKLLSLAKPHLKENGFLLLLKGEEAEKELETARKKWSFKLDSFKSLTNPNSVILKISELDSE